MTGLSKERILDRLPFLGLDIESTDADSVRIEYNPNRPDFSTDYGIARALRGLVGKELGPQALPRRRGEGRSGHRGQEPREGQAVHRLRGGRGLRLDDETIRQLISMQEDLHNGHRQEEEEGRHRAAQPRRHQVPRSTTAGSAASLPVHPARLDEEDDRRGDTPGDRDGRSLRARYSEARRCTPCSIDSKGIVLSFPPIINGNADEGRHDARSDLFIDVTSTDERVGDEALAIICSALADAGAKIEIVHGELQGHARTHARTSPPIEDEVRRQARGEDDGP